MEPRFPFGRNWTRFLLKLDERRILEAERSLSDMVGRARIAGASFLDVGSGSGVFSLAAMRLGARRVHSFDVDADSVLCTREVRRRYFPDAERWSVDQGSVLDAEYVRRLGSWDVVYAWGVLHHTGDLWRALDAAIGLVDPSGRLFVAIYNDQGRWSRFWTTVKGTYNRGRFAKAAVLSLFVPWWIARGFLVDAIRRENPLARYREYQSTRGMSLVTDWQDWLGGYPFEVATPEQVFDFCRGRGLTLTRLRTRGGGNGCNEFVFDRGDRDSAARCT
jgi:2-polyprenyl-3-methyl-5-hydroxy-6-metoxy-1,4-benzoquinol methylase